MNRREFVAASCAAAAGATCQLSAAASIDGFSPFASAHFVFDRRFEPSRRLGLSAAGLIANVHEFGGDVTSIWDAHLEPLWRGGAGIVVGMTTPASLRCLQQLAACHWFRVIARIDHPRGHDRTVAHRIVAETNWADRLGAALQNPDWAQALVPTLLTAGRRGIGPAQLNISAPHWRDCDTPELVSWHIAGRQQRQYT
jgi:hypothetical protein